MLALHWPQRIATPWGALMTNRSARGFRGLLLLLAASTAVAASAGSARAAHDGDVYGGSSLPLAQCDVRSAIGAAMYEADKRQAEGAPEQIKMLKEFERLSNASTAQASEPIYKGLSVQDNIRGAELSQRIKLTNFNQETEGNYSRDIGVIDRMFVDAEGEYKTGLAPQLNKENPKAESNLIYAMLLAARESIDNSDMETMAGNSSECSIDYALMMREAEPMKQFSSFNTKIAQVQSKTAALKAEYGALDPTIMSKDDATEYQSMRSEVALAARTATFIADIENLRLLVRAAGLRRESYIRDMMTTGLSDGAIGSTLKRRLAANEFDKKTVVALGLQDMFSSLFPSQNDRFRAAAAATMKPK